MFPGYEIWKYVLLIAAEPLCGLRSENHQLKQGLSALADFIGEKRLASE
jgi:hypothetical protein